MRFHSSVTFVWNSSHSKKNCARCDKNCIMIFMSSTCYSRPILMKLQFTRYIFEKHSNIKLHEKTVQWELSCSMWTDGRTRHDEANSRFSQFCEKRPNIQCVPLATESGISLIIVTPMKILQRNLNRSTFGVWEMKRNVSMVRFKFRCNILISGKIIKEMPGSIASGTHCT